MRASEKCLPEEHKKIVYWHLGMGVGFVTIIKGKLCVGGSFSKPIEIKSGFLWCYESDIEVPKEM